MRNWRSTIRAGLLLAGVASAADGQTTPTTTPSTAAASVRAAASNAIDPLRIRSRLVPLYYFRDAERIARIIREGGASPVDPRVAELKKSAADVRAQAEKLAEERRKVETELARNARIDQFQAAKSPLSAVVPAAAAAPGSPATAAAATELQRLRADENRLRQEQFRLESLLGDAGVDGTVAADLNSDDPVSRVVVNVVGEGQLHLRGPLRGVNRIARLIHQIDRPVGQAKIGVYTIQVNGEQGEAIEAIHDRIDQHISNARFLCSQAGLLFRRSVAQVAATHSLKSNDSPHHCFFNPQFTKELAAIDSELFRTENRLLTLNEIESMNPIGALYTASLASDESRAQIIDLFTRNLQERMPEYEAAYFRELNRSRREDHSAMGLLAARFQCRLVEVDENRVREHARRNYTFANLRAHLDAMSTGTLNNVQLATLRLATALKALNTAEIELNNLQLQRSLLERRDGEIEASAFVARRSVENARESLQLQKFDAEAVAAQVLETVILALDEAAHRLEIGGGDGARFARLREGLKRLSDPVRRQELAPMLLAVLLESPRGADGMIELRGPVARRLNEQVAVYMRERMGVVFELADDEQEMLVQVASAEIARRAGTIRTVLAAWAGAVREMEQRDRQHAAAVQNESVWYRRLVAKRLLEQFIDEQDEKVIELWESLRAQVATVDGYLKQLAVAFEDDVDAQFTRPTFQEVRRASRYWNVTLGQIESTTVLANDRSPARVSPAQTVQLDLPRRKTLIAEGLSAAEGVTDEALNASKRFGVRAAAATAAGPAGLLVAESIPVGRPLGDSIERLVPKEQLYTFDSGNSIEIIPVIQPDGYSLAYRFIYAYANEVDPPEGARDIGRIQRHFIKADVQTSSYELREVSRFRVALKAARTRRGVPLLGDAPWIGALFRPLPSQGVAVQENIILADCVIYPTVFDLMGPRWLRYSERTSACRLIDDEKYQQHRRNEIREQLLSITNREVDELIGLTAYDASSPIGADRSTPSSHAAIRFADGADRRVQSPAAPESIESKVAAPMAALPDADTGKQAPPADAKRSVESIAQSPWRSARSAPPKLMIESGAKPAAAPTHTVGKPTQEANSPPATVKGAK